MRRWVVAVVSAMVIEMAAGAGLAQATRPARPAPSATGPVAVLDTYGVWRTFHVFGPPVIAFDDGPKPVMTPQDWLNRPTAPAPAGWMKSEFDDSTWQRGTARAFSKTPYLERLYQRARFEVTDLAAVKDIHLSLSYYGGASVYLNGRKIADGNLPKAPAPGAGQGSAADLAEAYPPGAFVDDTGKILPSGWMMERYKKELALRERSLAGVVIPAKALRKGVNVIAIEIIRAPFHKIVDEKKTAATTRDSRLDKGCPYDLSWNTCETRKVQLTAAGDDGLVPNAARPTELQVWNGDFVTPDYESDQGDRCEPLRPVTIKGVRNGWHSGKVVLGSPKPIEGLKAVVGDLKQGADTIPASAVRIRYAVSWGGSFAGYNEAVRRDAPLLDALLESPRPTFAGGPYGTVIPIWATVKVPAQAKPGAYQGELTITAKDEKTFTVPVRVEVADWTAPDAKDYRTWVELIQSPDTLATEYNVPLWSDKHWELIGQSLRYIGEIGSRVVYVPLIAHTNSGNAESMVRWIKKDSGQVEYDFTIMDKYLDLAARYIPKPKFVVFTSWEVYLNTPKTEVIVDPNEGSYITMEKSWARARWELRGKGPAVTALDPASGKTETVYLPRFEDPAAKAMWKPLFDQLRAKMTKRGWEGAMSLGMASDYWPSKDELATLQDVSGGLHWVRHTHGGNSVGMKMHGIGPIDYTAYVWNVDYAPDPAKGHTYGWKQDNLVAQYLRFAGLNRMPPASLIHFGELNITGRQRGVGRIGADMWAAVRDKQGRRMGHVWGRYPQSLWHSLNLTSHLLVPGPEGPVASIRYEAFREGIQECEARIAIETVLTDDALKARIGSELARKCQGVLDERLRTLWRAGSGMQLTGREYSSARLGGDGYGALAGQFWFAGSGWQQRVQDFYALAGEVVKKAGQR